MSKIFETTYHHKLPFNNKDSLSEKYICVYVIFIYFAFLALYEDYFFSGKEFYEPS
jgi:hypothetical protein